MTRLTRDPMHDEVESLLLRARALSWEKFGKRLVLYLPGMFVMDGQTGQYPAISISGENCALQCAHCAGKILKPMCAAITPEALVEECEKLHAQGAQGCLITGGSDARGRMPWNAFLGAIRRVKQRTGLHLSVHAGIVGKETARALKDAGVDQALVDVVGAEETAREVMHLDEGVKPIWETLDALFGAGLEVIPHIVIGLHFGRILGEPRAVEILRQFDPRLLVWVVLMPLRYTPMAGLALPPLEEIGRLLAQSRLLLPETEISLGCARPRGKARVALECMAIDAGVNRLALYSEEAIEHARSYGLEVMYRKTCCSLFG